MTNQYYKQLYLDFCKGDQQASNELVNTFSPRIFNYMRRAFSPEYASDYVQLAWLKLVESCKGMLQHDNVGAFIMVTAKHAALDEVQKHKAKRRNDDGDKYRTEVTKLEHNDVLNPEYLLDKEEEEEAKKKNFQQALAGLSLVQRQVLHLRFQQHSLAEIAEITNTKKETVKTRLRHAKDKLKKLISGKH